MFPGFDNLMSEYHSLFCYWSSPSSYLPNPKLSTTANSVYLLNMGVVQLCIKAQQSLIILWAGIYTFLGMKWSIPSEYQDVSLVFPQGKSLSSRLLLTLYTWARRA